MSDGSVSVVTGAAGFIGSHMVDLMLDHGHHVRAIDNLASGREENLAHCKGDPNLAFEALDVRNLEPDSPLFRNADYVFHFAGIGDIVPSIERPVDYLSTNVMGTIHA